MGTGKVVKVRVYTSCAYGQLCGMVWGGVGDRSTGCHRTFGDPDSEGF